MNIEERVKLVIANVINIDFDKVCNSSDLRFDLGADSLDVEGIYSEIETEFGILCDWNNDKIRSVQDVIDIVVKELNNKQGCCV